MRRRAIPDKRMGQAAAEAALVHYLANVRHSLRATITVESILSCYAVSPKVADYRLTLAQAKWAREAAHG